MPIVLLGAAEDLQILLESLIGPFTGSISLRVICCANVLIDLEKAT